jgi:two-component system CheB/CheR fusion protein
MGTIDQTTSSNTSRLVVVGSSAGGIEALSILVSTLPASFPAPVLLAQHLDPSQPSSLGAILQQRTSLPVKIVTTHTSLRPGEIYVVPANHHVTINDGYAEVQVGKKGLHKPSVDLLFSSAAKAYGDRLIAAILTGSGSDGAIGAIDVKHAGGVVVIQNPQTARFPSMPLAIPPTIVDFQVDIERIGPLLYKLLMRVPLLPAEERGEVLDSILEYMKEQMSLNFRVYRTSALLQHIGYRMLATNTPTMQAYLNQLKSNRTEVEELKKSLLATSTQFFHDPDSFAFLRSAILPELLDRARDRSRTLRCWLAECATGEEAYAVAMLIADLLGAELPWWSLRIFATDPHETAINFARRGVYTEDSLKQLPPGYVECFFEHVDQGYRVVKQLRRMVIFGQQDLGQYAPFPHIALVMCRNRLSYFTADFQQAVLNQFAFSLFPGGYLFLGKAETVRLPQALYEVVSKDWNIYRCIGNAMPGAAHPVLPGKKKILPEVRSSSYLAQVAEQQRPEREARLSIFEHGQLRHFHELLIRSLPIGIVVIDRAYHIVTANGLSRRLLRMLATSSEQDFLHTVPGIPYAQVRTAIDAAFRGPSMITLPEVELDAVAGGSGRFVALSIAPIQLETVQPELVAISVIDVTEHVQTKRRLEAIQAEQVQLVRELGIVNKRLDESNQALIEVSEALDAANEDMIMTREELHARLKELETINEECRSNFEEVEANNEELQTSKEALESSNIELQSQNALLASERMRLTEIIEHAPFYVMGLRGPHLLVETFNSRWARLLQGQDVLNQPLEDVFGRLWQAGLPIVRVANEVYQQDIPRAVLHLCPCVPEVPGEDGERYLTYTIVPSHDVDGKVSGVIIYATNEARERLGEAMMSNLDVSS